MNWMVENWPWLLIGAAFVGLHLVGHGGHGGHGSHRSTKGSDSARSRKGDLKPPHEH
jgi:hypothetical protein